MAGLDLPERAMRQQIASAVNVVIQVSRLGDGTRKLLQISEIVGMEGDVITMQDIFVFERQGIGEGDKVLGQFKATGIRPKFADRLKAYGIDLGAMLFSNLGDRAPRPGRRAPMVGLPTTTWAAAIFIFLAVALGTLSIALLIEYFQERRRQQDALRQLRAFTDEDQAGGLLRAADGEMPRWLRPIAARIPAFQDLDLMMDQADLKGHLPTFLLGTLGLSLRVRDRPADLDPLLAGGA